MSTRNQIGYRHGAAAMCPYIFLDIERIAVVRLQNQSYIKQNNKHQIINQLIKKQQRRKRSFLKLQANASSLKQILSFFVINKKAIQITFALIHKTQATQTAQLSITSPTASYFKHLDMRVAVRR